MKEVWLYNYIKNPKHLQPDVEMPRFRFSEKELVGVVAYMKSEYVDFDMSEPPLNESSTTLRVGRPVGSLRPHAPDPQFYEKGLALVKKYNCGGCHDLGTMKSYGELGPELSYVGSKKMYEIDFGQSGIEQSLSSYLVSKLKSPRIFSSKMKMPNYELGDEEAQAIAVALLGNTNEPIP